MGVDFEEDDSISSYTLQLSNWKVVIPAFPDEAEKRTASVLWIWLSRLQDEINEVLSRYEVVEEVGSDIIIQIHGVTDFIGNLGPSLMKGGYSVDNIESMVKKSNLVPMVCPQNVILVIRDDLHLEYYCEDNNWERIVTGIVMSSLISMLVKISAESANEETKVILSNFPLTPKIHTHATALALIGALKN